MVAEQKMGKLKQEKRRSHKRRNYDENQSNAVVISPNS